MTLRRIRRDIVQLGERRVHYRVAGEGPPVVLLHQSPHNSAELLPLMQVLAPHFLVIAPDTPGYGQSDPVAPAGTEPGIDLFADALIGLLDALDLERVALFGSHTGAGCWCCTISAAPPRRSSPCCAVSPDDSRCSHPICRATARASWRLPSRPTNWRGS